MLEARGPWLRDHELRDRGHACHLLSQGHEMSQGFKESCLASQGRDLSTVCVQVLQESTALQTVLGMDGQSQSQFCSSCWTEDICCLDLFPN